MKKQVLNGLLFLSAKVIDKLSGKAADAAKGFVREVRRLLDKIPIGKLPDLELPRKPKEFDKQKYRRNSDEKLDSFLNKIKAFSFKS